MKMAIFFINVTGAAANFIVFGAQKNPINLGIGVLCSLCVIYGAMKQ